MSSGLTDEEKTELAELESVNSKYGDDPRLEATDFFDRLYSLRARAASVTRRKLAESRKAAQS